MGQSSFQSGHLVAPKAVELRAQAVIQGIPKKDILIVDDVENPHIRTRILESWLYRPSRAV